MLEQMGDKIRGFIKENFSFMPLPSREEAIEMFPHAQNCVNKGPIQGMREYSYSTDPRLSGQYLYFLTCDECDSRRNFDPNA